MIILTKIMKTTSNLSVSHVLEGLLEETTSLEFPALEGTSSALQQNLTAKNALTT